MLSFTDGDFHNLTKNNPCYAARTDPRFQYDNHSRHALSPILMARSGGSRGILTCFPDDFASESSSQDPQQTGDIPFTSGDDHARPIRNPFRILDNDCTIEILQYLTRDDIINLSAVDGVLALKIREAHHSIFPRSRTPAARKSYLRSVNRHATREQAVKVDEPPRQAFKPGSRYDCSDSDLFSGGLTKYQSPWYRPSGGFGYGRFGDRRWIPTPLPPDLFLNTPEYMVNSTIHVDGQFSRHLRVYTEEDQHWKHDRRVACRMLVLQALSGQHISQHRFQPLPNLLVASDRIRASKARIAVPAAEPSIEPRVTRKKRLTAEGERKICAQIMQDRGLLRDRHIRKPRVQDEEIGLVEPYDDEQQQDGILWMESEDMKVGLDAAG